MPPNGGALARALLAKAATCSAASAAAGADSCLLGGAAASGCCAAATCLGAGCAALSGLRLASSSSSSSRRVGEAKRSPGTAQAQQAQAQAQPQGGGVTRLNELGLGEVAALQPGLRAALLQQGAAARAGGAAAEQGPPSVAERARRMGFAIGPRFAEGLPGAQPPQPLQQHADAPPSALEALTDELFDAELQRRLARAASSAAAGTSGTNARAPAAPALPSRAAPPPGAWAPQQAQRPPPWGPPAHAPTLAPTPPTGRGPPPLDGPFATPPPDAALARGRVRGAVTRELSRMGYYTKDPLDPRSLALLRDAFLVGLLADCGEDEDGDDEDGGSGGAGGDSRTAREARLHALLLATLPPGVPGVAALQQHGGRGVEAPGERGGESPAADADASSSGRSSGPLQRAPAAVAAATPLHVAAMGDARRMDVLRHTRKRQRLLAAAADPDQMAGWLVVARAQDVMLLQLSYPAQQQQQQAEGDAGPSPTPATGAAPASSGSSSRWVLLATGLSQAHAAACAEAVRHQLKERLESVLAEEEEREHGAEQTGLPLGAGARDATTAASARGVALPPVCGDAGADWLSLEAGPVEVHVLTAPARSYYRLEALFTGRAHAEGAAVGVRRFEAPRHGAALTLDTITPSPDFGDDPGTTGRSPVAGAWPAGPPHEDSEESEEEEDVGSGEGRLGDSSAPAQRRAAVRRRRLLAAVTLVGAPVAPEAGHDGATARSEGAPLGAGRGAARRRLLFSE